MCYRDKRKFIFALDYGVHSFPKRFLEIVRIRTTLGTRRIVNNGRKIEEYGRDEVLATEVRGHFADKPPKVNSVGRNSWRCCFIVRIHVKNKKISW